MLKSRVFGRSTCKSVHFRAGQIKNNNPATDISSFASVFQKNLSHAGKTPSVRIVKKGGPRHRLFFKIAKKKEFKRGLKNALIEGINPAKSIFLPPKNHQENLTSHRPLVLSPVTRDGPKGFASSEKQQKQVRANSESMRRPLHPQVQGRTDTASIELWSMVPFPKDVSMP